MYLSPLLAFTSFVFALPNNLGTSKVARVNLRVEGATKTIFEGSIKTFAHNVTTASGGQHRCDGTNNGANPLPGPTCTGALDTAAKKAHFTYDGTFDAEFDDFFITSIGGDTETSTQFWGLLNNFQFTPVGGCQEEVTSGDQVLWAFDAFNKVHFLKASAPHSAKRGHPVTVNVVDGSTGTPVTGAKVAGNLTDVSGNVVLTFKKKGLHTLKAHKADSIRSNLVSIYVK